MSKRSDAAFMKELFETHRQTMYKIALSILHNSHDAEDAVQNAFLWIINNLEKISPIPCNERVFYFATVIEHVSINILNKKKRHPLEDIDMHQEINSGISVEKTSLEMKDGWEIIDWYADEIGTSIIYESGDERVIFHQDIIDGNMGHINTEDTVVEPMSLYEENDGFFIAFKGGGCGLYWIYDGYFLRLLGNFAKNEAVDLAYSTKIINL